MKILTILLCFFAFAAKAQTITYVPFSSAGVQFKYQITDSGFNLPFRELSLRRGSIRPGSVICNTTDSLLYYYNGVRFVLIGVAASGNRVDSLTLNDSVLCVWQQGASVCTNLRQSILYAQQPAFFDSTTIPGATILKILQSNGIVSGGTVSVDTCNRITVIPTIISLNYVQYSSPLTFLIVPASDPSLPRMDEVIDSLGTIILRPGIPSSTPVGKPYNPAIEVLLASYTYAAGATCIGISQIIIYDQNIASPTEWTHTTSGTVTADFDNVSNPLHLTKAIKVSSYASGASLIFTKSSPLTATPSTVLKLPIFSNAAFTNQFQVSVFNGSTAVGIPVAFGAAFGFNPNDSNRWQQPVIPFSAMNIINQQYDKVVVTMFGNDLSGAKGYLMDWIQIQEGANNVSNGHGVASFVINGIGDTLILTRDDGFVFKVKIGSGGGAITLKTNGTNNGSQSILNLVQGSNVTLSDNGSGSVTISSSAPGTGTVTNIATGYGLSGGPITSTGTIKVDTSLLLTKLFAASIYLQNITGLVTQGTNVTITGSGTSGSPYVINSSAPGTGTVTSIATTLPITGGTITTTGTIACATCVVATVNPSAGVAHFAGGTQTTTSSLIVNADITNSTIDLTTKVTGVLPIANGGTNNGSLPVTAGTIYYGDGTKLVGLAPGTSAQVLHSGTTPSWKDTTASGSSVSISQAYGILNTPNPITGTGSIKSDTAGAKATVTNTGYLSNIDHKTYDSAVTRITNPSTGLIVYRHANNTYDSTLFTSVPIFNATDSGLVPHYGHVGQVLKWNGWGDTTAINTASGWTLAANTINAATDIFGTLNNASVRMYTNSTEKAVLDSNGRFGVGIHSPTSKIHLVTNALGVTQTATSGLMIENQTAAALGAPQMSPSLTFSGKAWNSTSSASQDVSFRFHNLTQSATSPLGSLLLQSSSNGSAFTTIGTFDQSGNLNLLGAITAQSTSSSNNFANFLFMNSTSTGRFIEFNGNGAAIRAVIGHENTTGHLSFKVNDAQNMASGTTAMQIGQSTGDILINTTTYDNSAILNLVNTGKGVLLPRMTQLQRDSINLTVTSVTITAGGTGYAGGAPNPIFNNPGYGGVTATGTAVVTAGAVTSVTITNAGSYLAKGTVAFTAGTGSGATGTVNVTQVLTTGLTIFCTNCTATDASTGVMQTWNGSAWKNNW